VRCVCALPHIAASAAQLSVKSGERQAFWETAAYFRFWPAAVRFA
jgi:hypothetical protein